MRVLLVTSVLALLTISAVKKEHPLKMSFSKLSINSDGLIELETRIFLDDLTEHMQKEFYLQQVDFSSVTTNGTQTLQRYLKQHFFFEQDGQQLDLWINGVSISRNRLALVVNLSTGTPIDMSKEVFLVNTLLCDAFPVQINDVKYLGKHYQLGIGNPKVKLSVE